LKAYFYDGSVVFYPSIPNSGSEKEKDDNKKKSITPTKIFISPTKQISVSNYILLFN